MPLALMTSEALPHWSLPPERAPPWLSIESSLLDFLSPLSLTFASLPMKAKTHPIILHLKVIWKKKVSSAYKSDSHLSPSACFWLNPKLQIDKKKKKETNKKTFTGKYGLKKAL